VADPEDAGDSDQVRVMRGFNDKVVADPRVDVVMLPIRDGVTMAVKR